MYAKPKATGWHRQKKGQDKDHDCHKESHGEARYLQEEKYYADGTRHPIEHRHGNNKQDATHPTTRQLVEKP